MVLERVDCIVPSTETHFLGGERGGGGEGRALI